MAKKRRSKAKKRRSEGARAAGQEAVQPAPAAAEADVPAVWNVGDVILDLYEVKQVHEGGAMGLVYRVRHRTWNVDLAVKSPRPERFQSEADKENFEREAETWVNLDLHPHIVSCHYVRRLGGIPRLFAEYVEGGSLSEWIRERKLYEGGPEQALERILDIAIQMAWGLNFAHAQGLVHQDVKPANVMMTPDGLARVTDFGLSRARAVAGEAGAASGDLSIMVSWGGRTPAYASPEQEAGKKLSRRTDIWSWAVSVLEMFTGGVTWGAGPAAGEALEEYLEGGAEGELPAMPQGLADLLRRCFAWEPDGRTKDMEEVATALQEVYRGTAGRPYPREAPEAVEHLADGLNNRALSMLDLGKVEEAERLWDEALEADPRHPHATYNRGLHLWRGARITDDVLVRQLEAVRGAHEGDWIHEYLLGMVHLERVDPHSAILPLREAREAAPGDEAVAAALHATREQKQARVHCSQSFRGHTGAVTSVALTADGRFGLSGSLDKTVRLWDLPTGRCLRALEDHSSAVTSVALTPDGRFALSGGWDQTLRLWELATGRCERILESTAEIASVALTPDGRFALSASRDGSIRLWELATGRCLRSLEGQAERIESVALTADLRFALCVSGETVRLWDLATGRSERTLEGHTRKVTSVALTPDGRFALSGSWDKTLRLWELATGRCLRSLEGHTGWVESVALTARGHLALSASRDKTLRLWELATGRCLLTTKGYTDAAAWVLLPSVGTSFDFNEGHMRKVTSVALTPDGRFALSGSSDETLRLWELDFRQRPIVPWSHARPRSAATEGQEASVVREALVKASQLVSEGAFEEAAAKLRAARSLRGYQRHPELARIWHQTGEAARRSALLDAWPVSTLEGHTDWVTSVAVTADGRFALSGGGFDDQTLRFWELATGRCLRTLEAHFDEVSSVALTADGRLALSGSHDTIVRLWELATGRCLRALEGHSSEVKSVALTADRHLALSASRDGSIRLWELATGRCLRILEGHTDAVTAVALTADGRLALSGSRDGILRLWSPATGQCLRTVEVHFGVSSVMLTADGRFALSGSHDESLRLWELATGHCLRTLEGHSGEVESVALTADGRFALSGCRDGILRLWELATGRCLRTLEGHTDAVAAVALTPDGRFALSGSRDNTVRLWEFNWDYEFPDPADWDDGARPYLETFLTLHTPYAAVLPGEREPSQEEVRLALTRQGKPSWGEEDFQRLIKQLQYVGYGWLRPEGVRAELERMARDWEGPPPLFDAHDAGTPGGRSFLSRLFGRGR